MKVSAGAVMAKKTAQFFGLRRQVIRAADCSRNWALPGGNSAAMFRAAMWFPEQKTVAKKLEFVIDFANAASSGEIDAEAISRGQFDDNFLDFLEDHGQPIEPYLQGTQ